MRKFFTVAAIALALTGCASQTPTTAPVKAAKTVEAPAKVELAPVIVTPPATPTVEAAPVDQAPMDTITAPEPVYVVPVAPVAAPVAPVAPTTKETPKAVAVPETIMEDDPRWDCHTMGNKICGPTAPEVPTIPPYTDTDPVPPVVTPAPVLEGCSEFETRAEDGTCVPNNYWDEQPVVIPPHAEPNPVDCDNLALGDAHAGIGLVCGLDKK